MRSTLGVYVLRDRLVCVETAAFGGRPGRTHVTAFDAQRPADAVASLRAQFGAVARIALSVGLAFLHLKHIKLPPASSADRRRILALEPDRFFAVQDETLAVALEPASDFAFAADAGALDRWISAFEQWAPVDLVESAPQSLARALGPAATGAYTLEAGDAEEGVVELHNGRVRAARRALRGATMINAVPVPAREGLTGEQLIALGAARGMRAPVEEMLLPEQALQTLRARRRARVFTRATLGAAALALLIWALDWSRELRLQRITRETEAVAAQAGGALELRERLGAVDREATTIAELLERRLDPIAVLQALSERLPAGATVLNIEADADGWQIEGTALDAAAIVPVLAGDERFQDVRILSASTRFTEGNRTLETFSLGFRVRPGD